MLSTGSSFSKDACLAALERAVGSSQLCETAKRATSDVIVPPMGFVFLLLIKINSEDLPTCSKSRCTLRIVTQGCC